MDLMKTFASAWVAIFLAPLTSFAQLPVAPFSAPSELIIPSNMPGIRPGTYRLAPWLKYKTRDNYREDYYIQRARKRGSIVSYFLIERSLTAESEQENRYTARLYDGWFLPRYRVSLERFDCQNDQSMADFRIVLITDAWGDEGKRVGLCIPPINPKRTGR